MASKTTTTPREKGVPDSYLSESGKFVPGKDATYKSDLVNSALGLPLLNGAQPFKPSDAEARLEVMSWTSYLDRKRQVVADKAAKAEERKAKATAAAAGKKAAAKAKKEAPAEETPAEETPRNEVKPDPKPEPKPRSSRRR